MEIGLLKIERVIRGLDLSLISRYFADILPIMFYANDSMRLSSNKDQRNWLASVMKPKTELLIQIINTSNLHSN